MLIIGFNQGCLCDRVNGEDWTMFSLSLSLNYKFVWWNALWLWYVCMWCVFLELMFFLCFKIEWFLKWLAIIPLELLCLQVISKPLNLRREESLSQGEKSMIDDVSKKVKVMVPTPLMQLLANNYWYWATRMEVHLNAQGLWEVVAETEINWEDKLALSIMLAAILKTSDVPLDIMKSAKKNWEII